MQYTKLQRLGLLHLRGMYDEVGYIEYPDDHIGIEYGGLWLVKPGQSRSKLPFFNLHMDSGSGSGMTKPRINIGVSSVRRIGLEPMTP